MLRRLKKALPCKRVRILRRVSPDREVINVKGFRVLRTFAFLLPVAFIALLEIARVLFLADRVPRSLEALIAVTFLTLAAILFSYQIFAYIDSVHGEVSRRNRQLDTLYRTGVAINSTLGLRETIQLIIDEARALLKATSGELALTRPVLDLEGSGHAIYFSGFDPRDCRVQNRPRMSGLNGEVLRTGKPLRIDHRVEHEGSVALPPGHFPFDSILSVPLKNVSGECIGAITLVKMVGEPPFNEDDEALLVNFANQAAIAIVNASLYEQVRSLTVLEERERIARDMHDGLGQVFAYLSIEMKIMDDLLAAGKTEEAARRLKSVRATAEDTSVDVRETIVNLRTPLLPEEDLLSALNKYLKDFSERNEIKVDLVVDGALPEFSRGAQIQIICIIQEALANVRKHAAAGNIEVGMFAENGTRTVWVRDDGHGFDPAAVSRRGRHLGLSVMEERAREARGELSVKSRPGEGTTVEILFGPAEEQ